LECQALGAVEKPRKGVHQLAGAVLLKVNLVKDKDIKI
jgi:hypothetical protein